ncbi:MAG: alpha/beta hydrolase-fold protein [Bacteroidales bacterium]
MKHLILNLAILISAISLNANEIAISKSPMNVQQGELNRITYPSVYMEDMVVDIWTPNSYDANSAEKLNVLYMHDGAMVFDAVQAWNKQSWMADSVSQDLMDAGKVTPFMIVAIHSKPGSRTADFLPQRVVNYYDDSDRAVLKGLLKTPLRADKYLKFIVTELKPYIDTHYNVNIGRENTAIMGSSMGGLISLYAICEYPTVFGGAGCVSTHLSGWSADVAFVDEKSEFSTKLCEYMEDELPEPNGDNRIYFDYGNKTLDAYYPPHQKKLDAAMRKMNYTEGENWETLFFDGESHSENSWAKRLDIPLTFLFGIGI